jgi:hypothetical protein
MLSDQEKHFLNVTLQEAIDLEKTKKEVVISLAEIESFDDLWKSLFYNPDTLPKPHYFSMATAFVAKIRSSVWLSPDEEYARTQAAEMEKEIEQNGKGSGILQLKVIPGFDYRTMNDKIKKVSVFFFFRDGSGIVCPKKLFGPFILLDKTELRKSAFSVLIDYV